MSGVEIVDKFLDKEILHNINKTLQSNNFAWFISKGITEPNNPNKEHYNFVHKFFADHTINSNYFDILKPIIDKLEVRSLIRIKANLYPRTHKIIEHDYHSDFPFSHKSALLMMNTNDGFTIMKDGEKIKTKKNRMLLFDASKLHKSTSCTNENYKMNIVFNYF
jgi:hypothetical protein